ncbi:MAG: lamin tail domain-containing protein [Patescibacteria group bacterium]|jgi:hypothetical protein
MKKVVLFFLLFLSLWPWPAVTDQYPILINQVMIGQNEGAKNELVELYNPNDSAINLAGYTLKKKTASGSETTLVSAKAFNGIIRAKSYFLISSPEFKDQITADLTYSSTASLSKNNTLILYDNDKKISDKIGYGEVNDFIVQATINPENNQILKRAKINLGEPNNLIDFFIEEKNIQIENSQGNVININNFREEISSSNNSEKKTTNSKDKKVQTVSLKNVKNLAKGDLIITEGIVSVLPGKLGTQYFYIHDYYNPDNNIYGLQVYNYNKKFPSLKIGDRIKISGEVAITENETGKTFKIKTKEIEDIKIISADNSLPTPPLEKIVNLDKSQTGNLKTIKGELTQNKTNQIYLDDGNEILIEIKKGTGISTKILKEGQTFSLSGILSYTDDKFKLIIINEETIENLSQNEDEKPLGEVLNEEFWELESKNNNKTIFQYLAVIIFISGVYLVFNKKINRLIK